MRAALLLAAVALAAPAGAAAPVQTVSLYSYGYAPAPIRLAAGRAVTLRFVNRAGKGHDFIAPAFFARSRILSGMVRRGEVSLRSGESAELTLVPAGGTYQVHCGRFMHKQLGMKSIILVD